jgi:hypothetical protein
MAKLEILIAEYPFSFTRFRQAILM